MNQTQLVVEPLYDMLERLGVDLRWLDKARSKNVSLRRKDVPIPIYAITCSLLSIYLMQKDGRLWTITSDGAPYMVVRTTDKNPKQDTYACMHCKAKFGSFAEATNHYSSKKNLS